MSHPFNRLAIVAHSMEGLVSRGAIFKHQNATQREDIRLFIGISTPWGGDASAKAAGGASIALPVSFEDMNPSSDYLRWVFYEDEKRERMRKLPKRVHYHMFLGFRMSGSGSIANDGSVTLESQARIEAQEQTMSIRAWDHGHTSILHSPETVARMKLLLSRRF